MNKTITLDYEEYEQLKEKAKLKQKDIDKMRNKLNEDHHRIYMDNYNRIEKNHLAEIEFYKDFIFKIKKRVIDRTNVFGYVKSYYILDMIKDFEEEE